MTLIIKWRKLLKICEFPGLLVHPLKVSYLLAVEHPTSECQSHTCKDVSPCNSFWENSDTCSWVFSEWWEHFREQGGLSGESAHLPPMWWGGGLIQARCHMWVEFVFGSRLAQGVFLWVLQFTSLHKNQHLQIPNFSTRIVEKVN